MIKAWVNDLNTTAFRIVVSVWIAAFVVVVLTIAMVLAGWEPTAMQLKVLTGIAAGVLTMMGFDVAQFIGKRFSDATYAAAKNPSPVTVEAPSTVSVSAAAPAAEAVGAAPAPAQPAVPIPDRDKP